MKEEVVAKGTLNEWIAYYPAGSGTFYVNKDTALKWETAYKRARALEVELEEARISKDNDFADIGKLYVRLGVHKDAMVKLHLDNEHEILKAGKAYAKHMEREEWI